MDSFEEVIDVLTRKVREFFEKAKGRSVIIQTHNVPDPDALASAEAMRIIARSFGFHAKIISYGLSYRRENNAMIKECKIPLKQLNSVKILRPSKVAWIYIDCIPGGGNVKLHSQAPGDLYMAIDHHGRFVRDTLTKKGFVFTGLPAGATASILVRLLFSMGIKLSPRLASALSYAIITDTMDFSRGTSKEDIYSYNLIFPATNHLLISRLRNVKKQRTYFKILNRSLNSAFTYRNIAWAKIGEVETGEFVAEMADLILSLERITWSFAVGYNKEKLFISIRTSQNKAHAGNLIKKLVPKSMGAAGGHEQMAGGFVFLDPITDPEKLAESFTKRFIHLALKLKESTEPPAGSLLVG